MFVIKESPPAHSPFLNLNGSLNWLVISALVPAPGRWPGYRRLRRCFPFQDSRMKQKWGFKKKRKQQPWALRHFKPPQQEHKHTYPVQARKMSVFKRGLKETFESKQLWSEEIPTRLSCFSDGMFLFRRQPFWFILILISPGAIKHLFMGFVSCLSI